VKHHISYDPVVVWPRVLEGEGRDEWPSPEEEATARHRYLGYRPLPRWRTCCHAAGRSPELSAVPPPSTRCQALWRGSDQDER